MPAAAQERFDWLLAGWVLGRLASEQVPALAVAALQRGCGSSAVAVWAGLQRPTRAEIDSELPRLLKELGLKRPTPLEAMKTLVDDVAGAIVGGGVAPLAGARLIWDIWRSGSEAAIHPESWLDIGQIVGFAYNGDDADGAALPTAAEVTERARALLERGGLNISARIGRGQLDGREIFACELQEHQLAGVRTVVRLALELADGLYFTFGAAPDGASLELGFRRVRAYDLGEHGNVELRKDGFPCDVLARGTSIGSVTPLVDESGRTVAVHLTAGPEAVYVSVHGDNIAVAKELPSALAASLTAA